MIRIASLKDQNRLSEEAPEYITIHNVPDLNFQGSFAIEMIEARDPKS
jgi:hypothetical protein